LFGGNQIVIVIVTVFQVEEFRIVHLNSLLPDQSLTESLPVFQIRVIRIEEKIF